MSTFNNKQKAFTTIELLVVMIITGILFLVLFNSILLFNQATQKIAEDYQQCNLDIIKYKSVDNLFKITDSIIYNNNYYFFYNNSNIISIHKDSLFNNTLYIKNISNQYNPRYIDSIIVTYINKGDTIELFWGVREQPYMLYKIHETK